MSRYSTPKVHTEILSYDYMFLLYKAGYANWNLWGGRYAFQHIINTYGTTDEKKRLSAMGLGYRYEEMLAASPELTLSDDDRDFLRVCGIECE